MNSTDFSNYLKTLRKSNFLSIRQLSQLSGVSNSYISQVENGKRGTPTPDILEKLAPHLSTSYEVLMEQAGYINLGKKEGSPLLTVKDELDIEKRLKKTMDYIEKQDGLMLSGQLLDETDRLLLKQAIEIGLKYAKQTAKSKFTNNKHKKQDG